MKLVAYVHFRQTGRVSTGVIQPHTSARVARRGGWYYQKGSVAFARPLCRLYDFIRDADATRRGD